MDYKARMFSAALACVVFLFTNVSDAVSSENYTPDSIKELLKKVNTYTQEHPYRETDRNWVRGTYYTGVLGAYEATNDSAYIEQAMAWGKKHKWQVGTERPGSNRLFCAVTWVQLNLINHNPKKIEPTVKWLATDAPNSPGGAIVSKKRTLWPNSSLEIMVHHSARLLDLQWAGSV